MLVFIHFFTLIFVNGCILLAVFTHLLHLFFYSPLLIPRVNLRFQDVVGEHTTASGIICHLTTTYHVIHFVRAPEPFMLDYKLLVDKKLYSQAFTESNYSTGTINLNQLLVVEAYFLKGLKKRWE